MKIHVSGIELQRGKLTPQKKAIMLTPTLVLLVLVPLYLLIDSSVPLQPPTKLGLHGGLRSSFWLRKQQCDVFRGQWVPYPNATYYTNETCPMISDQQNCLKFGRPDTEFLRWRWMPDSCELPRFDAVEFLDIVKGKSVAFVGDSVGRNQMQSLLCLLAGVSIPLIHPPPFGFCQAFASRNHPDQVRSADRLILEAESSCLEYIPASGVSFDTILCPLHDINYF